jgi:hypothetical protein
VKLACIHVPHKPTQAAGLGNVAAAEPLLTAAANALVVYSHDLP